jgi:hypothetical protein
MKNVDKKGKKSDTPRTKRTWLKDVDYKNGGLISENKKKMKTAKREKAEAEKNDTEGPAPKKKKTTFLSSKHKEEHDNIFSKKFKANKFEDKRKRKK